MTHPDRADGQPRTGTRYIVQTQDICPCHGGHGWHDVAGLPQYKDLYEAIFVRDRAIKAALNEQGDELLALMKRIATDVNLKMETRIVKRTITTTDEVVDEAGAIPIQNPKA